MYTLASLDHDGHNKFGLEHEHLLDALEQAIYTASHGDARYGREVVVYYNGSRLLSVSQLGAKKLARDMNGAAIIGVKSDLENRGPL